MSKTQHRVAVIMGSQSDWPTMKHAADILDLLEIEFEARIVSAHRTPERMAEFAKSAKANGFGVIIAGAGGAAHLPGMVAAQCDLPVFGVPVEGDPAVISGESGAVTLGALMFIMENPEGEPLRRYLGLGPDSFVEDL